MPKVGDVVVYRAFGRELNAIVIGLGTADLSHQGANGEPVLNLLFIDPARNTAIEKKQIGWHPQPIIEFDVVHASHEFSAEFKKQKGILAPAHVASQRGHGEWVEVGPSFPPSGVVSSDIAGKYGLFLRPKVDKAFPAPKAPADEPPDADAGGSDPAPDQE